MYRPILLCILDGFGISGSTKYNAIKQANTKFLDYLFKHYPNTELETSGEAVGLPAGQMGNSEVGHMTIGSGRIILQDLLKINRAVANNELAKHQYLLELIESHRNNIKAVHLLGLCSDGGVHSHINHLIYIAETLSQNNITVKLHLFLDGRDTPQTSAETYLKQIDNILDKNISIATIAGRFYAMDRDHRWERTSLAMDAIVSATGNKISNWPSYLRDQYQNNIFDEFIVPAILPGYAGVEDGDSLIFINFRSDRIIQLANKLLDTEIDFTHKIGMTSYSSELDKKLVSLFAEEKITNNLAEILSLNNKTQFRIAETEKYAHITFFFNGGREESFLGEDRMLEPSPKIATYDLKPEMSAYEVTNKLEEAIQSDKYDFILVNYANGDMVGHSGKMDAAIKAIETLDKCLEKLYKEISKKNGMLIIAADHGNVECMFDEEKKMPHTFHTLNPVPILFVANDLFDQKIQLIKGNLTDIAPTILKLMKLQKPKEMTGKEII